MGEIHVVTPKIPNLRFGSGGIIQKTGGDLNPKHGENGGVTPNSGAGKFGSPHQTYIPDRKSR